MDNQIVLFALKEWDRVLNDSRISLSQPPFELKQRWRAQVSGTLNDIAEADNSFLKIRDYLTNAVVTTSYYQVLMQQPRDDYGTVMLRRLIAEVSGFIGAILTIAGVLVPLAQYLAWLWTDVWHPISIRAVLDAMSVSTPQAINAILELPLWFAMLTVGLVFLWIAAEAHERQ